MPRVAALKIPVSTWPAPTREGLRSSPPLQPKGAPESWFEQTPRLGGENQKKFAKLAPSSGDFSPTPGVTDAVLASGIQALGTAKIAILFAQSELAAKGNADTSKPWTMEQIKKDPKGFTQNLTQLDGDVQTNNDKMACAPTALLGGALLSDPQSVQELGKKLQSPAGKKEFPKLAKAPASESVARLASGTFSANDVKVVSNQLHDSMQYTGDDGAKPSGMPSAREMAMLGKLKKIGWNPPAMDSNTFGDPEHKLGNHVNAFANGTGYDPWPYPGSNGKAGLTEGNAEAMKHGAHIRQEYGLPGDYQLLDKKSFDGKGHLAWERNSVDGKMISPPLKASYSFDEKSNSWLRDPTAKIDPKYEKAMPAVLPLDTEARKKLGGLEVDD